MADNRNFIEQTQSRARLITGKELSPDELATEFSKSDLSARVDYLQQIESDFAEAEHTPATAAKIYSVTRALKQTHEKLTKVGR